MHLPDCVICTALLQVSAITRLAIIPVKCRSNRLDIVRRCRSPKPAVLAPASWRESSPFDMYVSPHQSVSQESPDADMSALVT